MATYQQQQNELFYQKLQEYKKIFPPFAKDYLTSIATTSVRTQDNYCYNINQFLMYLVSNNPELAGKSPKDITLEHLNALRVQDLNEYIAYMLHNKQSASSYIFSIEAALNSFFSFFEKTGLIDKNPTINMIRPRMKEKLNLIYLVHDEMCDLLDTVSNNTEMSEHRKKYYEKTRLRDTAMIVLFLKTGIRVSECVGLNLTDIDLKSEVFAVYRKGYTSDNKENQQLINMDEEVLEALGEYIEFRKTLKVVNPKDEDALFLSMQLKRMSVRAVQYMVKKYALDIPSLPLSKAKKISPHKLRKSYGTDLYHESNDIYLVATGLNHNSVATTAKYYAAMDPERKKQAYTTLQLKSSENLSKKSEKSDIRKQIEASVATNIQNSQNISPIQNRQESKKDFFEKSCYKRNN